MFKRLIIAAVLTFGMQSANAATLDSVEVITGAPPLVGTGSVTSDGSGGVFFSGSGSILVDFFVAVSASDASFSATSISFPPPPSPPIPIINTLTAGPAIDSSSSAGVVQFLYSATSNTLGSDYDLFRVSILHSGGDLFGTSQQTQLDATITLDAVRDVPPIPLPAGIWLMLSGVGGLMYFGRRRA